MRFSLFILCIISSHLCNAQNVGFNFVKTFGGLGYNVPKEMVTDKAGNIYTTGIYAGNSDLDPGPDSIIVQSPYKSNVFVQKLDPKGELVWAKSIGGPHNDYVSGIAVDDSGYVFVFGFFDSTVNFNPGGPNGLRFAQDEFDPFIVKYTPDGKFVWALCDGGVGTEYSTTIRTDKKGNIFVAQYYEPEKDFAGGPYDSRITKYSRTGSKIWQKIFPGGGTALIGGKEIRNFDVAGDGSVYLAGDFNKTFDANPGSGTINVTSNANSWDIFVIKLNADGSYGWVRIFGGASNEYLNDLQIDKNENIYLTGVFRGTTDLDPVDGKGYFTSKGTTDMFVEKLDSNGNVLWVTAIGSDKEEGASGIALNKTTGDIFLSGGYMTTMDFDPGSKTYFATNMGGQDIFILTLDSFGKFKTVSTLGSNVGEYAETICTDKDENLIITGGFNSNMDFDPSPTSAFMANTLGNTDVYILKLNICYPTAASFNYNACRSFSWNTHTYKISGTYVDTFTNMKGCDSMVTLKLTVTAIDTAVSMSGKKLTAKMNNANYQWMNCTTGQPTVNGQTQTYSPASNGIYRVIISKDNCSDTSSCFAVTGFSNINSIPMADLQIYPNPAGDRLNIVSDPKVNLTFRLTDMQGKVCAQGNLNPGLHSIDTASLGSGLYFLSVGGSVYKINIQH